jgi:hypothetical protein
MFTLTKWYFDVTTPDGDVAIAYCAEVRWGVLRQQFSGVLVAPAGQPAEPFRFSTRPVVTPSLDESSLRWSSEPLGLSVEYAHCVTGLEHRLYASRSGHIDWRCDVPGAGARIVAGGRELIGVGYVERLEMTLLPWAIPADEIRWGRFITDGASVVWIDWRGEHPMSLLFVDGRLTPVASITDSTIRLADGRELRLTIERVLGDDSLGGLLSPLDTLRPLIEPIVRTRQTRWLARGELRDGAPSPRLGWVIHEVMRRP